MVNKLKWLFLGAGNMAQAIALRVHSDHPQDQMVFYTPSGSRAQSLAQETKGEVLAGPREFTNADVIVLAFKPQSLDEAAEQWKEVLTGGQVVISLLAGVGQKKIEEAFSAKLPLLRLMPNTPCRIGEGVNLLLPSENLGAAILAQIQERLSSLGKNFLMTSHEQFDALTCVTGSGPAYIFEWVHQFILWAKSHGVDQETASSMVVETFLGALHLGQEMGENWPELIKQVTSKAGVTEKVLETWRERQLDDTLKEGLNAGLARAIQLQG